jgi:glycosyltransferase involved in cell wall biosynthesis
MISVIIPHFNQPEHLDRCLTALQAQRGAAPDTEVLVVDNGSKLLPEAIVARHDGVRLLQEPTPGPGPARNFGVAQSRGDILAFIDADCVPSPDWLAVIARRMAQGATVLGGDVRILQEPGTPLTVVAAYESEFAYRMEHYIRRQNFTGTGNLAMRRQVFDTVGPFAGIGIAEDRDWGHRAHALGHVITWAPDMLVFHPARDSMTELCRKLDRHAAHDFELITAKPAGRLRWIGRIGAMAVSPLAVIPRVMLSSRIPGGLGGRLKAFRGVTGTRLYRARRMAQLIGARDPDLLVSRWRE